MDDGIVGTEFTLYGHKLEFHVPRERTDGLIVVCLALEILSSLAVGSASIEVIAFLSAQITLCFRNPKVATDFFTFVFG